MGDLTKNFSTSEFACKCGCGYANVRMALVYKLQEMRNIIGSQMEINSGCRCVTHNRAVGGKPSSAHLDGLAADISCFNSLRRFELLEAARAVGFKRIGMARGFVHVDISEVLPTPRLWLY